MHCICISNSHQEDIKSMQENKIRKKHLFQKEKEAHRAGNRFNISYLVSFSLKGLRISTAGKHIGIG